MIGRFLETALFGQGLGEIVVGRAGSREERVEPLWFRERESGKNTASTLAGTETRHPCRVSWTRIWDGATMASALPGVLP